MTNKIKFTFNGEKFGDFIDRLSDLTTIDDNIKLKIDNDHILMYSILGGNVMLAFKNFLIKKSEYLDSEELDFTYDVIISSAKKFVKNLQFILDNPKITLELTCKQSTDNDNIMVCRSLQVKGQKLKINWLAGEKYETRDIDKKTLSSRLDLRHRKWSFALTKADFNDVKKLSSINSSKIISITTQKGSVTFSESSAWEIEVGEIEENKNHNLIFNKRFLNCINDEVDRIEFSMFETFILIKDSDSNLMLSYEQDFSDDDV